MAASKQLPLALFSIVVLFTQLNSVYGSFSITLQKNSYECFEINAPGPARSLISASYEITGAYAPRNKNAITVSFDKMPKSTEGDKTIFQTGNHVNKKETNIMTTGSYQDMGRGRWELCFRSKAQAQVIDIAFNMYVENLHDKKEERPEKYLQKKNKKTPEEKEKEKEETADDKAGKLMTLSAKLNTMLNRYEDHQRFMKKQSMIHRSLSEDTFSRVILWSLFEIFIVLVMGVGQILYIRRKFNSKRFF